LIVIAWPELSKKPSLEAKLHSTRIAIGLVSAVSSALVGFSWK
jgi:hypothetical protein